MAPQVVTHPGARTKGVEPMATRKSSAHPAHQSPEDHDPHLNQHDVVLDERPHACIDGWVFVGYVDEHGEEMEISYRCRRCVEQSH
jgi:hypothetical protein